MPIDFGFGMNWKGLIRDAPAPIMLNDLFSGLSKITNMDMRKILLLLYLAASALPALAQDNTIQLYSGKPPGSETWNWREQRSDTNMFQTPVIYNVVQPTLTVFKPAEPNGTAVVIAPGGGFRTLSINSEGNDVAKWLTAKGVTAFVLKYRLAHSMTNDPVREMMGMMGDRKKFDSANESVIPLAVSDGMIALTYVRSHAAQYHLRADRIGFMGFSAGGTLAMGVALQSSGDSRPNFICPIYAFVPTNYDQPVPSTSMPAFIAAASDDQLGLAPHSVGIYQKWIAAKQHAELHLYAKGGHGFGMRVQHLPSDHWIERFGDWLSQQGLLSAAKLTDNTKAK